MAASKPVEPLKPQNLNKVEEKKPVFKSGSALPSVEDHDQKIKDRAKAMFDDLDDDEDEDENSMGNNDQDFNANELLNFQDYQNRR